MWFVRRSSQVPNLMHTCIHWIYNFSHNTARFYVVAMPRTLNWEKRRVKKNNLAPLALRVQNILVYGARDTSVSFVLSSRMMKGQSVKRLESRQFSRILWAMFPRRSKKRSNVMIQMNLAKKEIYRSKKNGVLQSGNWLWGENMVSNPGFSLSPFMK